MLQEMRIRNLGVIHDATLTLGPGLNVITGETGAGKTLVINGLGLLLGGRSDSALVAESSDSAEVEGSFLIASEGAVANRALEAGADLDAVDGATSELLTARTVSRSGRGRAHLGGRTAPVAVLSELAEHLVAVHGQSDQILLRSPSHQREMVDRFGGHEVVQALAEYRSALADFTGVDTELEEVTTHRRERRQEADMLRVALAEIERVDPRSGEDDALREQAERLENAEQLRIAAGQAREALAGSLDDGGGSRSDVTVLLDEARRSLEAASEHDPDLADLARRTTELSYLAADLAGDLAGYAEGVDADPAVLDAVQQRRADLAGLTRRYGDTIDEVLSWAQDASQRLLALDDDDDRIDALRERHRALDESLNRLATRLRTLRVEAGARLGEQAAAELRALAMPEAELVVQVEPTERGPSGADDVAVLLRSHSGAAARPLGKGASGGELSRVMLALEVGLAGSDPVPTFVFDEIDAGVGGRAAGEIGKRLAALAEHAQVLVVTHLPQVAAYADIHLVVTKADDGSVTRTGVRRVDGEERVTELARMLAGQEQSSAAREHASELISQAARQPATARR